MKHLLKLVSAPIAGILSAMVVAVMAIAQYDFTTCCVVERCGWIGHGTKIFSLVGIPDQEIRIADAGNEEEDDTESANDGNDKDTGDEDGRMRRLWDSVMLG